MAAKARKACVLLCVCVCTGVCAGVSVCAYWCVLCAFVKTIFYVLYKRDC